MMSGGGDADEWGPRRRGWERRWWCVLGWSMSLPEKMDLTTKIITIINNGSIA